MSNVVFSPNLKYLVSVGHKNDGHIRVWDWKSNTVVGTAKLSLRVNPCFLFRFVKHHTEKRNVCHCFRFILFPLRRILPTLSRAATAISNIGLSPEQNRCVAVAVLTLVFVVSCL